MRPFRIAAPSAALLALVLVDCTGDAATARESPPAPATSNAPAVEGAAIASPHIGPAGEWHMPAGDYASSRYSELAQITPANAKNLHVAWTFSTGVLRGHEGQPLVVDNTMYIVTPYPNVAYALDLTHRAIRSSGSSVRRTRRRPSASRAATS